MVKILVIDIVVLLGLGEFWGRVYNFFYSILLYTIVDIVINYSSELQKNLMA